MADHQIPSQQANHSISANTYPHPAPPRLHGQNPHEAGENQQDIHREGVPHPVVMQGEMQYFLAPRYIDAPNYNAVHYPPPPPPHPYPHMHQVVGIAEAIPAQARTIVPEVQGNHDGLYGDDANFPEADPPEAFPGAWPHPAPPADMPPGNGLRILAGRFLNNPGTLVNMLRIEPGPGGRFEVWIALELVDLF